MRGFTMTNTKSFLNIKQKYNTIVIDPPYNIGKDFEGEELEVKDWVDWCEKWVKECNRVLLAGGAFYITLGFQSVANFKVMCDKFPELRLKNWIIWYRQDGWKGDNGYGHSYEHILYYIKDGTPALLVIKTPSLALVNPATVLLEDE